MKVEVITYWHQKTYGTPILLSPTAEKIVVGDAVARLNAMTGDWLVSGQKDSRSPYLVDSPQRAAALALTIDHYNRTGERKEFSRVTLVRRKATAEERP